MLGRILVFMSSVGALGPLYRISWFVIYVSYSFCYGFGCVVMSAWGNDISVDLVVATRRHHGSYRALHHVSHRAPRQHGNTRVAHLSSCVQEGWDSRGALCVGSLCVSVLLWCCGGLIIYGPQLSKVGYWCRLRGCFHGTLVFKRYCTGGLMGSDKYSCRWENDMVGTSF